MSTVSKHTVAIAFLALTVTLTPIVPVAAQEYPSRPVRIILPYAAGGSADVLARLLGARLSAVWGQQTVIDNRAGANGLTGTEAAMRAQADGYTLYMGTDGPMTISASLYRKVPYDWKRDFAPISMVSLLHQVLLVGAKLKVHNVKELIAMAKQKPGVLNYGSIGIGSSPHLAAEMFKSIAHVDITHVPYRGSAQATTGLLAGDVDMFFVGTTFATPLIQNGTVKGLAITARRRLPSLPDVPTFEEAWQPLDVSIWFALFAPAATPQPILKKINADVVQILADPEFSMQLQTRGFEVQSSTPAQLTEFLEENYLKFHDLIQKLGLHVD